ncbi:hypothetical protein B0684_12920 [Thioalkalivibrio versutus]|nr:hypothetical protein B0684_12920 [Thioalkalivibrio versutus]
MQDQSADVLYSSHFLEHVPRTSVPSVLEECFRILNSGGKIRLVLPDLENMAREYLNRRDSGDEGKADFVVMELIDQCVRRESGGELGRFYQALRVSPDGGSSEMIDYVRERVGDDLRAVGKGKGSMGLSSKLRRIPSVLPNRLQRVWIKLVLKALPKAFRAQNVSLAQVGERHHWVWDFHQLSRALEEAGFVDIQRQSAESSTIGEFPFYPLDLNVDGSPRKGNESMYVEARKP